MRPATENRGRDPSHLTIPTHGARTLGPTQSFCVLKFHSFLGPSQVSKVQGVDPQFPIWADAENATALVLTPLVAPLRFGLGPSYGAGSWRQLAKIRDVQG